MIILPDCFPVPSRNRAGGLRRLIGGRNQFALGMIGSPCCGCGGSCSISVTVVICSGCFYTEGATVTISNGGGTVATGVTDASGNLTLTWDEGPGDYTVVVDAAPWPTFTQTGPLICGSNISVVLATVAYGADGYYCGCDCCPIPTTLTLTDKNGSYTATFNQVPGFSGWGTGLVLAPGVVTGIIATDGSGCIAINEDGSTIVEYIITCNADGTITITRIWGTILYNDVDPVFGCPGNTRADCTSGALFAYPDSSVGFSTGCNENDAIGTAAWSSCFPFAWSGTLTGSRDSDPVGGTVTLESP
jgi:hypothetical protein